jgi:hypothetical protein
MSYYTDLDEDLGAEYEARENMREYELQRKSKKREFDAAVARQVQAELAKLGITTTPKTRNEPRGLMVSVKCKCGDIFQARKADRDRGWGRYCSKSCKAKFSR